MSTTSTESISTQLRTHVLDYTPGTLGFVKLYTRLGGTNVETARLYKDSAPDNTAYPLGIMRLVNRTVSEGYSFTRETPQLEIMLFHNSRNQAAALEDIADVFDMAMQDYVDSSGGLVFSGSRLRDTLPPRVSPADREVVQLRLLYDLVVYPLYLNSLGD